MPPPPQNAPGGQQATGGVQPGQSNAVVVADKVIVFGAGSGVFVYSGTPGLGNPPIAWMGGGLIDPFGNVLPSTTGIAGAGTFQAGNTLITPAGTFGYSGTPAAGNLVYSDTTAATTDPFGNAAVGGVAAYFNTGSGYLATQLFGGNVNFLNATLESGPWNIYSSLEPNTTAGFIGYFDNLGNEYNVGHREVSASANQQITSTGATDVTSTSFTGLSATSWHAIWDIFYLGDQNAGTPIFNLNQEGGAVVGFGYVEFYFPTSNSLTTRLNTTAGTFSTTQQGPTLVTSVGYARIEAWFTLSTGGNIGLTARLGTAGDTFHIPNVFGRIEKRS